MTETLSDTSAEVVSLAPIWIVAFSGHRAKPKSPGRSNQEINECGPALESVLSSLKEQAENNNGSIELITSTADGADLLAIDIAKKLDIPIHLILPMPVESFKEDFSTTDSDQSWPTVLQHIEKAKDPHSLWTYRIAAGDNTRPDCYHESNLQMLECADVLVTICTEQEATASDPAIGSTAETIRIASKEHRNIPTIQIDPFQNAAIIRRDRWTIHNDGIVRLNEINKDLSSKFATLCRSRSQRTGEDAIWGVHKALDNVANKHGDWFRQNFIISIWLHFGATVFAATTAAYFIKDKANFKVISMTLTTLELLLVLMATLLIFMSQRSASNTIWRRTRFGAELVDSQVHSAGFVDPLRPISMSRSNAWKRFTLVIGLTAFRQYSARVAEQDARSRFETAKQCYLQNRVARQIQYLSAKQKKASARFHLCSNVSKWVSIAALIAISAALYHKVEHWLDVGDSSEHLPAILEPFVTTYVYYLPILLPLIAGLASSIIVASDSARRASRYKQLKERLESHQRNMPIIQTSSAMHRLVVEIEDALLDEMNEWHATAENLEHMH